MLAEACLAERLFENNSERLGRKSSVGGFDRHRYIVEVNFGDDTTIYSLKVANIREELHHSIVHNHPPAGGWVDRGANDDEYSRCDSLSRRMSPRSDKCSRSPTL
jgi:hypothetical protein